MGDPQFMCRALTQGTTASVRVIPEHRIRTRIDVRVTFANAGPRQALFARNLGLRCKGVTASLLRMASGESRRTQFLRGVLDLCLLAVMEEGPAYGYEMTKRLRARGLSIVGEGSIYPLLGRLERDGLVETYRAASDGGPPRKYYRPSGDGRRALAAGVSEWRAARDAVDAVLSVVEVEVEP
jgi:PadR family transcriptional regulator PadR